jgi:hypothetical protein
MQNFLELYSKSVLTALGFFGKQVGLLFWVILLVE